MLPRVSREHSRHFEGEMNGVVKRVHGKKPITERNYKPNHSLAPDKEVRAREFIENLPAMESHFCRKSSKRRYIPTEVENFHNVHKMYQSRNDDPSR